MGSEEGSQDEGGSGKQAFEERLKDVKQFSLQGRHGNILHLAKGLLCGRLILTWECKSKSHGLMLPKETFQFNIRKNFY